MRKVAYPTPGEILLEEFLKPMGISGYRLAKDIGVSQIRISEIISGKRAITVDTGLRLSKYFGLNDGFWTGLQLDYEAAIAKEQMAKVLKKIEPFRSTLPEHA
ncbi:MAG: HigA family addiction module antidote protein [Betaproteobacteria bacterium]|nr:HigA family addiction module antidote protein [Betaproteobacteria bacterium]